MSVTEVTDGADHLVGSGCDDYWLLPKLTPDHQRQRDDGDE